MIDSQTEVPAVLTSTLLGGLDRTAVDTILGMAHARGISAKRTIFSEGQPAHHLYLVASGRARHYRVSKTGEEILLRWLLPGDVCGLGTLLRHPPNYIGSGQTLTDCELLCWHHARVRELAGKYPHLAENALKIVLQYLNVYSDRHIGLVTKNAQQRLAESLLDLGDRTGHVHPDGVEVDVTNEQLSALAHISPFTASKLLNEWERDGAVSKQRGKVRIHTPEALLVE